MLQACQQYLDVCVMGCYRPVSSTWMCVCNVMLQACQPQATAPVRLQRHAAGRETDLCPGADLQLPSGQWGSEGQGWGYVCVCGGVTQIHNPLTYNCLVVSGGGRGYVCVLGGDTEPYPS